MAKKKTGRRTAGKSTRGSGKSGRVNSSVPLELEVIHGDIKCVSDADVYVAGHYIDVTPQFAEEALDEMVSEAALSWASGDAEEVVQLKRSLRLVHSLTIRGAIRGALGDVYLFPMASWHAATLGAERGNASVRHPRMIAIAGMGHMGTFGVYELRRLGQSVAGTVARLPDRHRICSVLIGSGVGNLSVQQSVEGLVSGIAVGASETAPDRPRSLCIVERNIGRAHQIFRAAEERFANGRGIKLLGTGPRSGDGGRINESDCLILSLGSLAGLTKMGRKGRTTLEQALLPAGDAVGKGPDTVATLYEKLEAFGSEQENVLGALVRLNITVENENASPAVASTRLTCVKEVDDKGRGILSFAALSSAAVVPKRYNPIDWDLVLDVTHNVEALADRAAPTEEQMDEFPPMLSRLLIPRDFHDYVRTAKAGASLDAPLVFELDRHTAMIHWEMLDVSAENEATVAPVATKRQVSRQLRTEYSSAPAARPPDADRLGVLLIASPGDPEDTDQYLRGALKEVEGALKLFARLGTRIEIDVLAGSPDDDRSEGLMARYPPATRFAVLQRLLSPKHYDILHYSGHAWFDEKDQSKSGWYFSDGVLTAGELNCLDTVPQLVVANACVSARTAQAPARRRLERGAARDYALTPGLADEFFKRGVRAYVGTAWSIEDRAATNFAERFYNELLVRNPAAKPPKLRDGLSASIGDAMLTARKTLWDARHQYGLAWAAYQHYGDPTLRLTIPRAG